MNRSSFTRRAVRWFVAAAACAGAVVAGSTIHVQLAAQGHVYSPDDVPVRPTGMVLGARAFPGRPSEFLAARLDLGVKLFKAGKVKRLVVSGDGRRESNQETVVMRDYLVDHGVPADKIVEDPNGMNTFASCRNARDILGEDEVTIVSQSSHVPRAITMCRALGVDAVGVGDNSAPQRYPWLHLKDQARELGANVKMEFSLLLHAFGR